MPNVQGLYVESNHTKVVKILQDSAIDLTTRLKRDKLIDDNESIMLVVLPEDSSDMEDAHAYYRIWLRSQSSTETE